MSDAAGGEADPVSRQYEAYPYPARDPADERKRLIVGSPSHPIEIDHFLFKGVRDWSAPMRILIAGGGTGDALVMLAQLLRDRGTPAEIHYLDMSRASREIAEARIRERGLDSVTFHTADLLTAPELGPFDYIDCCGVLHHLSDPDAGFEALAKAMAPDGGMGGMVYAPDGRRGVYELQAALGALTDGLSPKEQVALARSVLERLPATHAFAQNPWVGDHRDSDAGLYDLLLHARDTPYRADALIDALERAGLRLAGFLEPARYDPATYLAKGPARDRAQALPYKAQAVLAERLAGNLKIHAFYAAPAARGETAAHAASMAATPVVHGLDAGALARDIAKRGGLRLNVDGLRLERRLEPSAARIVAAIDGGTTLGEIAAKSGLDPISFGRRLAPLVTILGGFNHLRFSEFLKR